MKYIALLLLVLIISSRGTAQNNITASSGESPVHKISDDAKALNEAIMDAQTNAVIAYGGNINVLSTSKKEETTESKKGPRDKKSKTSGSFSSDDKILLQNSVSAMVRNIEINADTVWIGRNKFRIRVNGRFEVNLKDIGNVVAGFLSNSNKKIKIELKENDCFGQIYKPVSEYINSKKTNFLFSNQPWLAGETNFKIEINSTRAVLYDKRDTPNVVIKIYSYRNCSNLTENLNTGNALLDEMISDIYAVYLYKSVK